MEALLRAFDFVRGPSLARMIWPMVARLTQLTQAEIEAGSQVLGPNAIPYRSVRVGEGRLLRVIFRFNGGRAFTTFRIVNLPASGHRARGNLAHLVHELVHVHQFERVGSVYIRQALRAQPQHCRGIAP